MSYPSYKYLGKKRGKINITAYPIAYLTRGKKMGEITYLNKAATKGESLRTTVPMSIVKQFGLTDEDKLDWQIKAGNGELFIQIKVLKNTS